MSLLLDALKKSEEQRRLGAQPDIHREAAPSPQNDAARMRLWLPLSLAVAAVLAISWFGWRQFREPEPGGAPPTVADATPPAPAVAERPAVADGAAATPGARTPVEDFSQADPQGAAATDASAQPAAAEERRQALQSFSEFREPATAPAGPAAQGTTPAATGPAPDAAAKPAPATPSTAATASPPASQSAPYEPAPMSYWALPQGVRDSLPAFRISVLVYAEDPADRFVLINGMRLREKQELQSGVVLDEIRRDGAVFRARNYRFLVKG